MRSGLQSSLLVRHPETKELFVNFDTQILTLIREAECMARLNLDVPASAIDLRARQGSLKENYNAMLVRYIYAAGHLTGHFYTILCMAHFLY